jgi:hypothetical protein
VSKASLRRYDAQAKTSVIVSVAGAAGMLALLFMIIRNYQSDMNSIIYSAKSSYQLMVLLLTAVTMLLAATAIAMGANSAGQKRNEKGRLSWLGFFIGGGTLSGAVILFAAFWFLKFPLN